MILKVLKGLEGVLAVGLGGVGGSNVASEMVTLMELQQRARIDQINLFPLMEYMQHSGIAKKVRGCCEYPPLGLLRFWVHAKFS